MIIVLKYGFMSVQAHTVATAWKEGGSVVTTVYTWYMRQLWYMHHLHV